MLILFLILIVLALVILIANIAIVPQAYSYVVERLGVYYTTWEAGFHFKTPFVTRIAKKVSLKEQVVDFKPQPVITRDNVTMQIDTVVFFQITDPKLFTYGVERPLSAIENLSATTLRNIIGDMELDHTLTSRDTINTKITAILDEATDKWGIKVNRVEVKNIIPPAEIQDAMEKQMKAERQRRESILRAEGEKKSAILVAEGEKESAILRADAVREQRIREAEGEAQALTDRSEGPGRFHPPAERRGPHRQGAGHQEPGSPAEGRRRQGHEAHHSQRDPEPDRPAGCGQGDRDRREITRRGPKHRKPGSRGGAVCARKSARTAPFLYPEPVFTFIQCTKRGGFLL